MTRCNIVCLRHFTCAIIEVSKIMSFLKINKLYLNRLNWFLEILQFTNSRFDESEQAQFINFGVLLLKITEL